MNTAVVAIRKSNTETGKLEVPVKNRYGQWIVHRPIGFGNVLSKGWAVTHEPSGRKVLDTGVLSWARAAARDLSDLKIDIPFGGEIDLKNKSYEAARNKILKVRKKYGV